ncbi:hypothetical protein BESB_053450 [Besnoitia besnoiti]|uniref:Carrier domain-containing protein n=1 Tax=Besnoitia besnoiti TaxID=94643 RepID=A0A2A9MEQ4_BESBE|nr:hypothetical protein BESB_053450 [Besnoitia besnoiti]PFH35694.1 hypothetical protein BESB_053450 [Besnoitia besnoiti]
MERVSRVLSFPRSARVFSEAAGSVSGCGARFVPSRANAALGTRRTGPSSAVGGMLQLEMSCVSAHFVLQDLRKCGAGKDAFFVPFLRAGRCFATSSGAETAHATGANSASREQPSDTNPAKHDVPVDTDIKAVTDYIVGMAEKFLHKDENVHPTRKLEEMRTKDERLWDCLDTVEFVLDVEEIFDVIIPDETADNFQTLQEIADYVVSQRQKRERTKQKVK